MHIASIPWYGTKTIKKILKMSTCNQLDLETLGCGLIMPKISLDTTTIVMISEGGLIESVGISEGDTFSFSLWN